MAYLTNIPPSSSESIVKRKTKTTKISSVTSKKHRVNWHEASSCAIQIELRDYKSLLEYHPEYVLGKNNYRIDLLIIKKLADQTISKNIAIIFKTINLFEMKGIGSCINVASYYKTIGYAGLLISQSDYKNKYSSLDISLTFLSRHYPRKLIQHLHKERKITVEKISPGVYHINKETFTAQIIVTRQLAPEDNLYLHCLTNNLSSTNLIQKLTDDYKLHQEQDIYVRYMHQLTTANIKTEGGSPMICEGLLNLCGTSSKEIIERTKKEDAEYYLPQIDYLKSLLEQNNIPFTLDEKKR